MPNTFTQMYIHIVTGVHNRQSLIHPLWKDELYKYITGIIRNNGHKLLAINGPADHLHIFIEYKPHQLISELMQDIKGCSSKWINKRGFVPGKFRWQEGYGAFSYAQAQVSTVIRYIENQEKHHRKMPFQDEYLEFLAHFDVDFEFKYVPKDPE